MLMASLILVPIVIGVISYLVPLKVGKGLFLLVQAFLAIATGSLFLESTVEGTMFSVLGGDNPILYVALRADRVSLVFVGVSLLLFTLAFLYASKDKGFYFGQKFAMLFLVLQGTMHGVFLTDDIFNLFVLLEVSTVLATVFFLFKREGRNAYDGLFYLVMQIVSMMFFLYGIAYLYRSFGVLNLTEIHRLMSYDVPREALILPFSLLITGIALKIGFFPVFSWVSHAYGNPSTPFPVLAILSGLFVKSSLFFVMRIHNIFYPVLDYSQFFIALGIITAIIGAVKALAQKDIRLMLAFSTISQIGLITTGYFLSGSLSSYGSVLHMFNHAIFKSLLFLTAGMVAKEYQTTHIDEIRGLFKRMPLVSIAMGIGVLGIMGFPFINGSISKYWIMADARPMMEAVFWVMNTGTILVFIKYSTMFFGNAAKAGPTDKLRTATVLILALLCVAAGIFGVPLANFIFGTELSITMMDFLIKGLVFFVIAGLAAVFYHYALSKTNALYKIAKSPSTIQGSSVVLVLFFATLLFFGMLS